MIWLESTGLDVVIAGQTVCQGLDLQLESGQCWGLLGGNGSGKTTLLHTLAGLRPPAAGQVYLQGVEISALPRQQVARSLGLLLQDSSDPFPATVMETALLGRHPHMSRWQWEDEQDYQIARKALASVGLAELSGRLVNTLSGGERRRLAIATLFTQQTPVLLLDEPSNHLDPYQQMVLLEQLAGPRQGAVLMSLHDINLAARFCSHLLLLLPGGKTLSGTGAELLDTDVLEQLYGYPIVCIESDKGRAFVPR